MCSWWLKSKVCKMYHNNCTQWNMPAYSWTLVRIMLKLVVNWKCVVALTGSAEWHGQYSEGSAVLPWPEEVPGCHWWLLRNADWELWMWQDVLHGSGSHCGQPVRPDITYLLSWCCCCVWSRVFITLAEALCFQVGGCPARHLLSACPLTPILRDTISSYLVERFLIKLATNIHHVSGNCWKVFQGQRSKVKVIARWNALFAEAIDSVALRLTCLLNTSQIQCSILVLQYDVITPW